MKKHIVILYVALLLILPGIVAGQTYKTERDIPYKGTFTDSYSNERCRLDVYYPDSENFKTVVWFHGGGLTGGAKEIPQALLCKGIGVVAVNYRLSPRVQAPAYIEDAAAAVAWAFENIARYGGDPKQVYVAGHSAGGYLVLMLALDKSYMTGYGADADRVKGYYSISGQTATHFQIRAERGLATNVPVVDKYAPLANVRPHTPPIILTSGQAELDLACRAAENRYLYEALKSVGNEQVKFYELSGFEHCTVIAPSICLMLEDMEVK